MNGANSVLNKKRLEWLINDSSQLLKSSVDSDKSRLTGIIDKCLPFVGEPQFTQLWIMIVDKLGNSEEDRVIFSKINQALWTSLLKGEPPPLSLLLHLWLTDLSSLEFCVIKLLELFASQCDNSPRPDVILVRSSLIPALRHEPTLHSTVKQMLLSLGAHLDLRETVHWLRQAIAVDG